MTALDLLRELAALKRHDPNKGRGNSEGKHVVITAPAEFFARIDALLANPQPYAYEIIDPFGCHALIYAEDVQPEDLEKPYKTLFEG